MVPLMIAGAALGAGGSILGGLGGKRAGDTLAGGYGHAMDEYRRQYDLDRPLFDPYINAGKGALEDMESQRGWRNQQFGAQDIFSDPSYRFRMNQGNQSMQGLMNSQGGYGGGNTLAALQKYGQGQASTEYGNAFSRFQGARDASLNRLNTLANQGQFGVRGAAALGSEFSGRMGEAQIGKAGARASGINSLYSGFGNAMSGIGGSMMGASMFGGGGGGGFTGSPGGSFGNWAVRQGNQMGSGFVGPSY